MKKNDISVMKSILLAQFNTFWTFDKNEPVLMRNIDGGETDPVLVKKM